MSYCSRSDIEALFGVTNVKKWADLDNDNVEATITTRITAAITYAQATVNDRLRGGYYAIPFNEPPPTTITDIAVRLAGVWLYESRGAQDFNEETGQPINRLQLHFRRAMQTLSDIRKRVLRLPLVGKMTSPEVVQSE